MKPKIILKPVLLCIFLSIIISCTTENNWPQFRGPAFNMVSNNENLPTQWNDNLNIKWTSDIDGESWSSPIVIGERIYYTTCLLVKDAPKEESIESDTDQQQQAEDNSYLKEVYKWEVACVDINSGKEIWKKIAFEGNPRIKKHASTNYAGESPVSDGSKIYAYFGMLGVYCYDFDGTLLWQKDLGAYKTRNDWGTGSSPVVYNGTLYIQVDNEENSFLVALDTNSGAEKWRVSRDEKTNYSTPVIWKNTVRTELVLSGVTARSYNPETGELLWQLKLGGEQSIPSPVFDSERIYLGNVPARNQKGNFFCVKAGAEGNISPIEGVAGSSIVWIDSTVNIGNPSPLLYEGNVYLLNSRGGDLACLDALTGKVIYNEKVDNVGACWASPWANRGQLYFYDEKGITQVVKAGEIFEPLHQNSLSGKFWSSVAITNDAYIIKGTAKLFCIGN